MPRLDILISEREYILFMNQNIRLGIVCQNRSTLSTLLRDYDYS